MIDTKAYIQTLDKKTIAVFGLGLSGLSVIKAFVKSGAKVYAWDDKKDARDTAEKLGAVIKELDENVLASCDFLSLAPGVPLHAPEPHQVVKTAQNANCDIVCDIEILHKLDHGRHTIALSGTNGKSTSTTLINHIFQHNDQKSVLAGNIGLPVFDAKLPPKSGHIVLEMSSFQLDLCQDFTADIAVLLNITPDHIDRHGSIEGYIAAKKRIFNGNGTVIIGVDDEHCIAIYEQLKSETDRKVIPISVREELENGVFVKGGILFDAIDGEPQEIESLNNITTLHGLHNKQNAAAAYAAAKLSGLNSDDILKAIKTYPGLPHRQFPVRIINGVAYINDSKATNAEATSKALACNNNIYWIAGGVAKDGGLDGLEPYMDKIKHAFLIGESAHDFEEWLLKYGVDTFHCVTLERAIADAHRHAQEERGQPGGAGVVLLSPACASYDQFKNFEERGDSFTNIVEGLEDEAGL